MTSLGFDRDRMKGHGALSNCEAVLPTGSTGVTPLCKSRASSFSAPSPINVASSASRRYCTNVGFSSAREQSSTRYSHFEGFLYRAFFLKVAYIQAKPPRLPGCEYRSLSDEG